MSRCKKDLRYEMYQKALERHYEKEQNLWVKRYKSLWEKSK